MLAMTAAMRRTSSNLLRAAESDGYMADPWGCQKEREGRRDQYLPSGSSDKRKGERTGRKERERERGKKLKDRGHREKKQKERERGRRERAIGEGRRRGYVTTT